MKRLIRQLPPCQLVRAELIISLHVSPHLQVLDEQKQPIEGVFAIGDNSTPGDGNRLPATAQVAGQMATYLGKALNKTSSLSELVTQPGFTWKNRGSMVFIGDKNVGLYLIMVN